MDDEKKKRTMSWEDIEKYCFLNIQKTEIEKLQDEMISTYYDMNSFKRSKYWKAVRELVIKRDNYRCTRCGCSEKLHVHHLNYQNHRDEHLFLGDLTTLCGNCHKEVHFINKW